MKSKLFLFSFALATLIITSAFVANSTYNDRLTAEVQQREGLYIIFPRQKPTFEYEYVKTIDAGSVIKN